MSVTIHVLLPTDVPPGGFSKTHPSVTALRELHELYNSSPYFSTYVDVHLALSPFSRTVAKSSNPTARGNGEGEGGRQFNVWRNVARLFARSEFVMMLDVDFAVCTDWRNAIRDSMRRIYGTHTTLDILPAGPKLNLLANQTSTDQLMLDLKNGLAALVVPAFEYLNQEAGKDQSRFPQDKEVRNFCC